MWCFFCCCFFCGVVSETSGLLDLGSFTSIAGGTTTSTCLECGGNRHHPSTKLDSPFLWRQSAELFMICFFYNPPGFFKRVGVEFFKKQLRMLDDIHEGCMKWRCKKTNTRGIDAARDFWFASNFLMIRQTRPTKLSGRSLFFLVPSKYCEHGRLSSAMLYCKKFETQIPLIFLERYCNLWKASVRLQRISWKKNVNVPLVRFVNFHLGIVCLLSPFSLKSNLAVDDQINPCIVFFCLQQPHP